MSDAVIGRVKLHDAQKQRRDLAEATTRIGYYKYDDAIDRTGCPAENRDPSIACTDSISDRQSPQEMAKDIRSNVPYRLNTFLKVTDDRSA